MFSLGSLKNPPLIPQASSQIQGHTQMGKGWQGGRPNPRGSGWQQRAERGETPTQNPPQERVTPVRIDRIDRRGVAGTKEAPFPCFGVQQDQGHSDPQVLSSGTRSTLRSLPALHCNTTARSGRALAGLWFLPGRQPGDSQHTDGEVVIKFYVTLKK